MSERGEAVIAMMVALGRTLGKRMIAEGVETEAQLARLVKIGCRGGQGYLLGRPMPADAAAKLVAQDVESAAVPRPTLVARDSRPRLATHVGGRALLTAPE